MLGGGNGDDALVPALFPAAPSQARRALVAKEPVEKRGLGQPC